MAETPPAIAALAAQLVQQIATTLQNEQAQRPSPGRLEPRLLTADAATITHYGDVPLKNQMAHSLRRASDVFTGLLKIIRLDTR
jgi:hypothetical protein